MEYDQDFFTRQQSGASDSALVVVPYLLKAVKPMSVVDVGCGVGEWLVVLAKSGVKDLLGIDGKWVDKKLLKIPVSKFREWDLTEPLKLQRKFDLVLCLEVAEHLPEEAACELVKSLCNLAPVVVFSAAIPEQGGVGHVNEQWLVYWAGLFMDNGYVLVDYIRPLIWENTNVEWWYQQNMVIFVKKSLMGKYPILSKVYRHQNWPIKFVHQECYNHVVTNYQQLIKPVNGSLIEVAAALPILIINEVKRGIKTLLGLGK